MMSVCNQCQAIPDFFDDKMARKDLKAYRKKGASKGTRLLLDALTARGVEALTLLDIGGGVGAIQHELLGAGVREAISVDASDAYIATARQESERQGHAGKVTYHSGNFVDMADEIAEAGIVTLDRVICCYPDMESLVDLSSGRAATYYGIIYPRDTWWVKVGFTMLNSVLTVSRNAFRVFVHSSKRVDAVVRTKGFEQVFYARAGVVWQVVLYARNGG